MSHFFTYYCKENEKFLDTTGKSVLKPESTPALQEVTKLLGADPSLKLWVVGHTDSVGAIEGNMKLSQARAEAVVTALTTTHGVAAARLKGHGAGPLVRAIPLRATA